MIHLIKNEAQKLKTLFPFALNQTLNNVLALDIETAPQDQYSNLDDAALNPWTAKITRIGLVGAVNGELVVHSFSPNDFAQFTNTLNNYAELGIKITGHNAKFDFKHLIQKGLVTQQLAKAMWAHDSNIAAALSVKKVPEHYLSDYEFRRQALNKTLPHGKGHRKAGAGSLKMLAPYFLGVDAFWESTLDHSDPRYNLLDCLYTYYLTADLLQHVATEIGAASCYQDLIERSKLLLEAELDGITLDVKETKARMEANAARLNELEVKIKEQWSNHFEQWRRLQLSELQRKYEAMAETYLIKHPATSKEKVETKYLALFEKAVAKADFELNLNSPEQLKWLLRDQLGYDITDLKDSDEESTGKAVLEHLAAHHADVATLIEYRKATKLQTAFYPELLQYASYTGRVHASFNITGARTGRLSSSNPNLQQQPKHLRELFIAAPGNVLLDLDMSMLEPILIAYYSEDPILKDLIKSGKSFHSLNAKIMFNLECDIDDVAKLHKKERAAAKLAGLSVLYGSGPKQLMFSLTGLGFKFNLNECKEIVYRIRDTYKHVWDFKQTLDNMAESGEMYYNYLGRPIKFDNIEDVYMKNFNGLIQGSGSDIVMQSAVDFCKAAPWAKLRVVVHDSICVEVPEQRAEEAKTLLDYHMTKWDIGDIKFKTEGGYGKNWNI